MPLPTIPRRAALLLPAMALAPRPAAAAAVWIVTAREAALPMPEDAQGTRAITRGPAIRYVSPRTNTVAAGQPFWLRVEFSARGQSRIDPASIRLTLLRGGRIDVTGRLRAFVSEAALDVPEALAPAGRHAFRIEVADDQGRRSEAIVDVDAR